MEPQADSQRPPRFIRDLSKLPRSAFHQLLDDLPPIQVLKILSHRNQYLQECIHSHALYGPLFPTDRDVERAVELFMLLREVYGSRYSARNIQFYVYGAGFFNWIEPLRPGFSRDVLSTFCDRMSGEIRQQVTLSLADYELLLRYGPPSDAQRLQTETLPKTYPALLESWKWIKEAKASLNMAKSQQLEMVADLIAEYPGMLMLKKPLDPSQDGPRPNTKHLETYFRRLSKKVLKDRKFNHSGERHKCRASTDLIPLVPYDKFLWIFLDAMSTHPVKKARSKDDSSTSKLDEKAGVISTPMADLELNEDAKIPNEESKSKDGSSFAYPENIEADINTVWDGMMYLYSDTGSGSSYIQRTDWDQEKPIFDMNDRPHDQSPHCEGEWWPNLHRCPVARTMPHDEREFVWLKAFLRAVTWMEENLSVQVDEKT